MSRRLVAFGLGIGPASLLIASAEAAHREAELALLSGCYARLRIEPSPAGEVERLQSDTPALAFAEDCLE